MMAGKTLFCKDMVILYFANLSATTAIDPIADIPTRGQCRLMTSGVTFSYRFSDDPNDDFGWLTVFADSGDFRGTNGMWVQWQDVVDFAERLSEYPISSEAPIEAEWGFTENGNYTRVTFISLRPVNARGGVAVEVDLLDYHDARRRCLLVFETTYFDIASFRRELELVMKKLHDGAVLRAA